MPAALGCLAPTVEMKKLVQTLAGLLCETEVDRLGLVRSQLVRKLEWVRRKPTAGWGGESSGSPPPLSSHLFPEMKPKTLVPPASLQAKERVTSLRGDSSDRPDGPGVSRSS